LIYRNIIIRDSDKIRSIWDRKIGGIIKKRFPIIKSGILISDVKEDSCEDE